MSVLRRWAGAVARKIRGVLGLSLIGGVFSAAVGGVIATVLVVAEMGMPGFGLLADLLRDVTPLFFVGGAVTTGGFATLLAATSGGRTLADLTYRRVALMGAFVGTLLPVGLIVAEAGFAVLIDVFVDALPAFGVFAASGAVLTSTLVALAKRAERRELSEGEREVAKLESSTA